MLTTDQVIPAAAGYYTLTFNTETQAYYRFPIVGWFYDVDATYPIVAGGTVEGIEYVLCPDGSVNDLETGYSWQSADDWHGTMINRLGQ